MSDQYLSLEVTAAIEAEEHWIADRTGGRTATMGITHKNALRISHLTAKADSDP
jgi:hypothetical protein